ncbi:MAG: hypothetical protein K2X08_07610 [Chlamydiales bacterium]|nr:hypothetical protein [Chlamydiales bacterium]
MDGRQNSKFHPDLGLFKTLIDKKKSAKMILYAFRNRFIIYWFAFNFPRIFFAKRYYGHWWHFIIASQSACLLYDLSTRSVFLDLLFISCCFPLFGGERGEEADQIF